MPFFAAFLVPVFQWLFQFFVLRFTTKTLAFATYAAIFSVTTLAFYAVVTALVSGVSYAVSDYYLLMVFTSLVPGNLSTCITAMFAAELAAFIYRFKISVLKLAVQS